MRDEQDPQSLLPSQVLSNLVMEELLPELRTAIGPRLKGKAQERQRTWIQVRGWGCWGVGRGRLPSPCLHCLCFAGMGDEGGACWGLPFPLGWVPGLPACRGTPSPGPPPKNPSSPLWLLKRLVVPLRAALPSPACAAVSLGRGKQTGGSPAPAIFSEPFLEQHRLNPARSLAKDRGLFKTVC